jgi:DNA-binding MarR family transcriptional regulator
MREILVTPQVLGINELHFGELNKTRAGIKPGHRAPNYGSYMNIDLVLKYLKDPEREYDAAEVAEGLGLREKDVISHLRSLWRGEILERRKDAERGRLVYRTKQGQLPMENTAAGVFVREFRDRAQKVIQEVLDETP